MSKINIVKKLSSKLKDTEKKLTLPRLRTVCRKHCIGHQERMRSKACVENIFSHEFISKNTPKNLPVYGCTLYNYFINLILTQGQMLHEYLRSTVGQGWKALQLNCITGRFDADGLRLVTNTQGLFKTCETMFARMKDLVRDSTVSKFATTNVQ